MTLTDFCRMMLALLCLLTVSVAHAESFAVKIEADRMQMQLDSNSSVYTGNVRLSRDDIVLTGERIIIQRPADTVIQIKVQGDPARFIQNNADTMTQAQSQLMRFDSTTQILELEQTARLDHDRQIVESELIRFDTRNRTMLAGGSNASDSSAGKQRVNIILDQQDGTP